MFRSKMCVALVLMWMLEATGKELIYTEKGLSEIPEEVFEAENLEKLDLSHNELAELSERIGDLSQLRELGLSYNKLATLSESIGDLSMLQELSLSSNKLTALPESIGNLSQLQVLGLCFNKLKELPERIGDLSQLKLLLLFENQLTSLPERIGNLSQLRGLTLRNNRLTSLPESIGGLSMLQNLDLRNNQLTSLPHTIVDLQRLILLNLRDNPLVERGEGDTLGWRDLRERFGDRVALSQDALYIPVTEINEKDVYTRLREDPLHWNIERLRHIRVDSVSPHTLSAHDLLDIWSGSLVKHAPPVTEGRDMASYIQTLYGVDKDAFRGWHMYTESLAATQDLLEAVLVRLRDSPSDAQAYVPEICEALKWCPDRQIACLSMVYGALSETRDTGTFEYFVEKKVGVLKSYILDMVVTPAQGTQNVHVRNTWRHILRDKLGVEGAYESRMGTFGQDVYGGAVGNVLDVFFRKFTPLYVIGKLKDEINESQRRLNEAGAYLHSRLEDKEYARRVFEYASTGDMECMNPQRITAQGVEDILVAMDILVRHTDASEDTHSMDTK